MEKWFLNIFFKFHMVNLLHLVRENVEEKCFCEYISHFMLVLFGHYKFKLWTSIILLHSISDDHKKIQLWKSILYTLKIPLHVDFRWPQGYQSLKIHFCATLIRISLDEFLDVSFPNPTFSKDNYVLSIKMFSVQCVSRCTISEFPFSWHKCWPNIISFHDVTCAPCATPSANSYCAARFCIC